MADSLDLFTGILLTVIGLVLVYGSIAYRLIDLILILGVLITLFGLYKLLPAFISRIMGSKKLGTSRRGNKLNKKSKNDTYSRVKEGAKEVENIVNSKLDGNNNSKSKSKSILETHDEYYSDDKLDEPTATLDEFLKNSKPKEHAHKLETPIDESKQVLKTKPAKEEKTKFKIPSIRKSNKSKKRRSFGYLKEDQKESNPDTVYFTPNYEKPMKVTRRPKKKSKETINLANAPKRSREISKALASVGQAETIYDNEVSEESYSLIPKTIDEDIVMPIDEVDLDEMIEEPVYNLSQSENTLYNNVIYDEASGDDVITPIYADAVYKEEHGIDDDYVIEYADSDLDKYGKEEEVMENDDLDYITPEAVINAEDLPKPTSIASTNPIASKKDVSTNLSRPHRKPKAVSASEVPEAVATPEVQEVFAAPKPKEAFATPKPREVYGVPKPKARPAEDIPTGTSVESEIPRPVPKAKTSDSSSSIDDLVAEASSILSIPDILDDPEETITIDPNNPESIPIPKLLNSYVICEKGILTSQEAFEEVASHSKEEILLEAPTVKDMGERFLSSLSNIKSRVIIQEFDLEDISYVILLSSLIKKGVEIKTLPSVDSFNLIGDTSHALLISNSIDEDDFEYGAVYDEKSSVESIKALFESSWELANDLDINSIVDNS